MTLVLWSQSDGHDEVRELLAAGLGSVPAAARLLDRARSGEAVVACWVEDGTARACATYHDDGDTRRLDSIVVAEPWRGRGVGRRVVEALGADGPGTLAAEADESAVGFFRRCGFAIESAGGTPYQRRYRCTLARSG